MAEELEEKIVPTLLASSPSKRKSSDIPQIPSLKKAKYQWQVKGRGRNANHHLAEEAEENNISENLCQECRSSDSELVPHGLIRSPNDSIATTSQKMKSNTHTVECSDFHQSNEVSAGSCVCDNKPDVESSHCHVNCNTWDGEKSVYMKKLTNTDCKQDSSFFCHCSEETANERSTSCKDNPGEPEELGSISSEQNSRPVDLPHADIFNAATAMPFSSPPRPHIDFLQRWQNQHTAKAIVDNAINKTLEGMGLSPDPSINNFVMEKNRVEDEAIAEAIQNQGLSSRRQLSFHQRLSPIISQLTQASELVFAQNLIQPPYTSSNEPITPSPAHSDDTAEQQIQSVPVSSSDLLDHAVTIAICSQGLVVRPETS